MAQVPFADVFTWPAAEPQLIGSKCGAYDVGQAGPTQVPGSPGIGMPSCTAHRGSRGDDPLDLMVVPRAVQQQRGVPVLA
ncbi:MAG TPA: hypothetical protein VLX59_09860, partial [Acidimicrobiales bacterium]|nr:hypothetical protein [Acidimicrobiales bacterium]